MPQNQAAFLEAQSQDLKVGNAPYHPPAPGEIVIENHAVAINPVDWQMQDSGMFVESYPTILGCDVAGIVSAVGNGVTAFIEGDRVVGQALNLSLGPKYGAFQKFVPCPENVVCRIPQNISFAAACAMPLSINTAAMALFQPETINLSLPSANPQPSKQTVLIYGGSGSVGSSAIQLAKAAGATVIATASEANFEYCRALGADHVLDYKKPNWIDEAATIVEERALNGIFDTIAKAASANQISELMTCLSAPVPLAAVAPLPNDIKASVVFGAALVFDKKLSQALWRDFVPQALEKGSLVPKPESVSAGRGLEAIQSAMNKQKKGVSAQKVVVDIL